MKKFLLSVSLLCSVFLSLQAQTKRICASNDVYLQQLISNPAFAKKQQEIEAFTQRFLQNGGSRNIEATQRGATVYTIPVVVHVVWNTAAQNISDAQVQSQIDVLNKDYQELNADTTSVPSVFKPLIADIKVQFCLAKQDPNGSASTGIVRVNTTKTSFSTNDAVKHTSQGGDDAWDATRYLNLWVCKLSGGVLGYAQFPGGAAATDGVVILYSSFGITSSTPYNLGRTATHEVGHWLNLRHIWGDDGSKCTGSDQVDDTPNQADENYGKPTFPNVSCSNGPNGDMFMNYMDYVDDDAMQMFSLGQKDRMWAVLQAGGARASLASSQGCNAPGGTTCTDVYEPNNAKTTAKAIAVNTDISAFIGTATDKDFFKFTTVSGATSFTVSMTSLPKNYTLKLFNASGRQLAASAHTGTSDESITYSSSTAATYLVQVIGATTSDFDASDCYSLKVTTTAGVSRQADFVSAKTVDNISKGGVTIYPQPASSYTNIRFGSDWKGTATLMLTNNLGQIIISTKQVNTESGLYKLDVSGLQNGMYYVKISNSITSVTSKIVVQR